MKEKYFDCVEKVSQIIFEAIATREENLKDKILEIDTVHFTQTIPFSLNIWEAIETVTRVNNTLSKGFRLKKTNYSQ